MARSARIVVQSYPFHITQRGNYRQKVFDDQEDRSIYLRWINEYSKKFDLTLLAYCLMDNHVHFVAIPGEENSLSKVFGVAHMRYSQYYNKKKAAAGHLWQGKFYTCLLDEMHLMAAMRYVEKNPVRASLVKKAWDWKWSSAGFHTGRSKDIIGLGDIEEIVGLAVEGWEEYLEGDKIKKEIRR